MEKIDKITREIYFREFHKKASAILHNMSEMLPYEDRALNNAMLSLKEFNLEEAIKISNIIKGTLSITGDEHQTIYEFPSPKEFKEKEGQLKLIDDANSAILPKIRVRFFESEEDIENSKEKSEYFEIYNKFSLETAVEFLREEINENEYPFGDLVLIDTDGKMQKIISISNLEENGFEELVPYLDELKKDGAINMLINGVEKKDFEEFYDREILGNMLFDNEVQDLIDSIPFREIKAEIEMVIGGEKGIKQLQDRAMGEHARNLLTNGHTKDAVNFVIERNISVKDFDTGDTKYDTNWFSEKINNELTERLEKTATEKKQPTSSVKIKK